MRDMIWSSKKAGQSNVNMNIVGITKKWLPISSIKICKNSKRYRLGPA